MYKNLLFNLTNEISIERQYNIIENNNYYVLNLLKKELENTDQITICGKGQTAAYIENAHGINQSIIFTNKKYMYANDFTCFHGVEEYIKDVSYIFFPDYPHIWPGKPNLNLNYLNFIYLLKKYKFNGNIFIYQIQTTLQPGRLNKFKINVENSGEVPIIIYSKFLNFKKFNLYGFSKYLGYGYQYHSHIKDRYNLDKIIEYHKNIDINKFYLQNGDIYDYKEVINIYINNRINNINYSIISPLKNGKKIIFTEYLTNKTYNELNIYVY